jgi:hypothetical protein
LKTIDVPGVGAVDFPEEMDDDAITRAIEKEILPQVKAEAAERKRIDDYWTGRGDGGGDDKPGYLGNLARGAGERALDLVGGGLRTVGTLAEAGGDWLERRIPLGTVGSPGTPMTEEQIQRNTVPLTDWAENLAGTDLGYEPRTTWEDVKESPVRNFIPFAFETGITSAPDAVAALLAPGAYAAARTGEIAQARAENDGRETASVEDLVKAAPSAAASALLERFGAHGMMGMGDDVVRSFSQLPGAVGRAAAREGSTEFGQEISDYLGEQLGTKRGATVGEGLERGLAGAVGGAPFGGGVRGLTGTIQVWAQNRGVEPTQENLRNAAAAGDAEALKILAAAGMSAEQLAALSPEAAQRFAERAESRMSPEQLAALAPKDMPPEEAARFAARVEARRTAEAQREPPEARVPNAPPPPPVEPAITPGMKPAERRDAVLKAREATEKRMARWRDEQRAGNSQQRMDAEIERRRLEEAGLASGEIDPGAVSRRVRPGLPDVINLGEQRLDDRLAAGNTPAPGLAEAVDERIDEEVLKRKRTEQAFRLARHRAGKAGEGIRDVQAGGRPKGGIESQREVFMDEGRPVKIIGSRTDMGPDGTQRLKLKVHRYDPRTEEAIRNENGEIVEYDVDAGSLTKGLYAQDPRRAQEFEEDAKRAPVGTYGNAGEKVNPAAAKARIDEVQGLPRQTYRTTPPDPTVPGAEGPTTGVDPRRFPPDPDGDNQPRMQPGGPVLRADRPEQGEGRRYDQGSGNRGPEMRGGQTRAEATGQAEAERRRRMWGQSQRDHRQDETTGEDTDWGGVKKEYEPQKDIYSATFAGVDADGWPLTDKNGYILSTKGGPIRFETQSAMVTRLKELRKQFPDAGIVNATHPGPRRKAKVGEEAYFTLHALNPKPAPRPAEGRTGQPGQEQAAPDTEAPAPEQPVEEEGAPGALPAPEPTPEPTPEPKPATQPAPAEAPPPSEAKGPTNDEIMAAADGDYNKLNAVTQAVSGKTGINNLTPDERGQVLDTLKPAPKADTGKTPETLPADTVSTPVRNPEPATKPEGLGAVLVAGAEKALRDRRVKPNPKAIARHFGIDEGQAANVLATIAGRSNKVIRQARPSRKELAAALKPKEGAEASDQAELGRKAPKGPRYRLAPQFDEDMSLLEFLMSKGGLARDGDLVAMDAHRKSHPRHGNLVRRQGGGGLSLDEARELAESEGYIGQGTDDYNTTTIPDLLEAIEGELRGNRVTAERTGSGSERDQMEARARELGIVVEPDWNDAELMVEIGEAEAIANEDNPTVEAADDLREVVDAMLVEMGIVPDTYQADFDIPFGDDSAGPDQGAGEVGAEAGGAAETAVDGAGRQAPDVRPGGRAPGARDGDAQKAGREGKRQTSTVALPGQIGLEEAIETDRQRRADRIQPIDPANVPDPVNEKPIPTDTWPDERLLVISCGISKSDAPGNIPAIERYTGPRYNELRKWIAANPGQEPQVVILSGKFGFIPGRRLIPDYNQPMTPNHADRLVRDGAAENGAMDAAHRYRDGYRDVFIVGGGEYTAPINATVTQLVQAGVIHPDAAINRSQGNPGVQKKQMMDWVGKASAPEERAEAAPEPETAPKPEVPAKAAPREDADMFGEVKDPDLGLRSVLGAALRDLAGMDPADMKADVQAQRHFVRRVREAIKYYRQGVEKNGAAQYADEARQLQRDIAMAGQKEGIPTPLMRELLDSVQKIGKSPAAEVQAEATPEAKPEPDVPARGEQREVDGTIVVATGNPDYPWAGGRLVESGPNAGWHPDRKAGQGSTPEEAAAEVQAGRQRDDADRTKRTDATNRWMAAVEAARSGEMPPAALLKGATRYGDGKVTTGDAKAFLRDMGLTAKQADQVVDQTPELDVTSGGARLYDLARIVRTGQNIQDVAEVVKKTAPPKAEAAPAKPLTVAAGVRQAAASIKAGTGTWLEQHIVSLNSGLERRKANKQKLAQEARDAATAYDADTIGRRNLGGLAYTAQKKASTSRERDNNLEVIKEDEAKLKELVAQLPANPPKRKERAALLSRLFGRDPKVELTAEQEAADDAAWKERLEQIAPRAETVADIERILDGNVERGILDKGTAKGIKSILGRMPTDGLKGVRLMVRDRMTAEEREILGTAKGVSGEYITLADDADTRVLTVLGENGSRNAVETFVHENAHVLFSTISDPDKALARRIHDRLPVSRQALHTAGYDRDARFEEWFAESAVDHYAAGLKADGPRAGIPHMLGGLMQRLFKRIVDLFSGEKAQIDAFFSGLERSLGYTSPAPVSVDGITRRERRGVSTLAILSNPIGTLTGDWKAWRSGFQELRRDVTETWKNPRPNRQNAAAGFARWFFYSADGEFRAGIGKFNSPTLDFLADTFHAKAGSSHGLDRNLASKLGMKLASNATFDESVTRKVGIELNQLSRILEPFDQDTAALDRIVDLVQNPQRRRNDPESKAASEIARQLKGLHAYMKDAGVDVGEVKQGYFPRETDVSAVMKNPTGFVAAATKEYRASGLGAAEAKEAADNWLTNILYGGSGSPLNERKGNTPSFVQSRVLTKQADETLKEFYQRDPRLILGSYISRAAKRAEIARRFGDGFKNWGEIEKQIRKEDPAAAGMFDHLQSYVATAAGVRHDSVSSLIRQGSSMVRTVTSVSLLEKSTLTSLGEAVMPAIRTGSLLDVIPAIGKTLRELRRDLAHMPPSVAAELAADIGAIAGSGVNSLMAARFAGGDPLGRGQARVLSKYFRRIGQEQWTNATRVAATERGAVFIRRLAGDIAGKGWSPKASRVYMEEMGIPAGQVDQFVKYVDSFGNDLPTPSDLDKGGEMGAAYRTALLRFVDQAIMRPTTTTKPRWASHPVGAVLFQLQAFNYAFAKNAVLRNLQLAKTAATPSADLDMRDRLALAYPVIMMLPLLGFTQLIVGELRDRLFMDPERRKAQTYAARVEKAISRTGLLGALDPYVQMVSGARYQKDPISALTGPFFGVLGSGLGAAQQMMGNNSPNTNAAERRASEALYDTLFEPMVNIVLGYSPASPLATLITMGLIPGLRDDFVDSVAGPRIGHKQQPIYGVTEILTGKPYEKKSGSWAAGG